MCRRGDYNPKPSPHQVRLDEPRSGVEPEGDTRQSPSTTRRPLSMSSRRTPGIRPACSTSSGRSISSRPRGTATESLGSPVAAERSNTLPAMPARSRLEVTGTTWVCQTSTPKTSSDETTTHGRRLSRSIQYTPPRATTERNAPFVPPPPGTPPRLAVQHPPAPRRRATAGRDSTHFDSESVNDGHDIVGNTDRLVRHVRIIDTYHRDVDTGLRLPLHPRRTRRDQRDRRPPQRSTNWSNACKA